MKDRKLDELLLLLKSIKTARLNWQNQLNQDLYRSQQPFSDVIAKLEHQESFLNLLNLYSCVGSSINSYIDAIEPLTGKKQKKVA